MKKYYCQFRVFYWLTLHFFLSALKFPLWFIWDIFQAYLNTTTANYSPVFWGIYLGESQRRPKPKA
jgi:hypothetical protein